MTAIILDPKWSYALPENVDAKRSREIVKVIGYPQHKDTLYIQCSGQADIPFKIGDTVHIRTTSGTYDLNGKVWYIFKSKTSDVYNVYVRVGFVVEVQANNTVLDSSGGIISLDAIPTKEVEQQVITEDSVTEEPAEKEVKTNGSPKKGISPLVIGGIALVVGLLILRKLFK